MEEHTEKNEKHIYKNQYNWIFFIYNVNVKTNVSVDTSASQNLVVFL